MTRRATSKRSSSGPSVCTFHANLTVLLYSPLVAVSDTTFECSEMLAAMSPVSPELASKPS